MKREDPNHYYERLAALREALASERYISTDTRTFNSTAVSARDRHFGARYESLRTLLRGFSDEMFDQYSDSERHVLAETFGELTNLLWQIQSASYSGDVTPKAERTRFFDLYRDLIQALMPVFLLRFWAADESMVTATNAATARIDDGLAQASAKVQETVTALESRTEELHQRIQEDLSTSAVAKNANFFEGEANRYVWQSVIWGAIAASWFGALIVGVLVATFNADLVTDYFQSMRAALPSIGDEALVLHLLGSKLIAFATLAGVGVILVRTFLSSLNLHVLNRHRAVSLNTYRFLLDGARTDTDRQHIIQRAAEAVFAIQETGLIRANATSDGSPLNTSINFPRLTG